MLLISRRPYSRILVQAAGIDIWVTFEGNNAEYPREGRIGIEAPPEVRIVREELLDLDRPACHRARHTSRDSAEAVLRQYREAGSARESHGMPLVAFMCPHDCCRLADGSPAWHVGRKRARARAG